VQHLSTIRDTVSFKANPFQKAVTLSNAS